MRRLAAIVALLAGSLAAIVGAAGADDSRSYRVEMFNAFGVLEGSEVRIAGVRSGEVIGLEVNEEKRAVATIEVSGPLATLGERSRCSTEPQSLIAEYFIDCRPAGAPLPDGATIPATRVAQTVEADLLFNTFRQPYRERLRLIVNEFGTALAGNAENLSQALRLSVPALADLRGVTRVLARQRGRLARLNVDAGRLVARLAERRDDVGRAIGEARDVAAVAAARRDDLARDADLLDDLLAELRPTLAEVGATARAGTPLLAHLRRAAPGLEELAIRLPAFSESAGSAIEELGRAAVPGREALRRGRDEIRLLAGAGRKAPPVAEILADLLRDLSDPDRSVETDARAARSCDQPSRPCWATGRSAPTGFSGLESILNYTRYQAGALNQFDELGHILQFNVFSGAYGPCDDFNARADVPARAGGRTTEILAADPCVGWLGPNQPDISFDQGLPRYDASVCPEGSTHPEICDPAISTAGAPAARARQSGAGKTAGGGAAGLGPADRGEGPGAGAPPAAPGGPELPGSLEDLLGLPPGLGPGAGESGGGAGAGAGLEGLGPGGRGGGRGSGGRGGGAAEELLDFLFGR